MKGSDMGRDLDLVVLFEHPEWQKPLFAALERRGIAFEPFCLKQGGSGARIQVVESLAHVESIFAADPDVWQPDNLFLLQEYLPHDPEQGIVRLEFLGGELLYAMRVKTHGRFNLCPSPVCNPDEGEGVCEVPQAEVSAAPPVEFYPYREVPREAVETAE